MELSLKLYHVWELRSRCQQSTAEAPPGVSLYTQDINSHYDPGHTLILNSNVWEDPPNGPFGVGSGYYNDHRYRRAPTENFSVERIFRMSKEGTRTLTVRVELNNAFNRIRIPTPSNTFRFPPGKNADGTYASGFGFSSRWINAGGQRSGQLDARINF